MALLVAKTAMKNLTNLKSQSTAFIMAKNTAEEVRGGRMMDKIESVAITSRIRLARNFSDIPFMSKLTEQEDINFLKESMRSLFEGIEGYSFFPLNEMSLDRCGAYLERHIISKELIGNRDISAVITNEDEDIIIMCGEEDHIREQAIVDGLNLGEAYKKILEVDNEILSHFNIAYSDDYGFLTSSPANLGSAMRASVRVFIPALERFGKIENLKREAINYVLSFRGNYGEGTSGEGGFYQISNQNSLGLTEEEIIDKVSDFFMDIYAQEVRLRKDLFENNYEEVRDEVQRAYGTLLYSYSISEHEMLKCLSSLKLGEIFGFVNIKDQKMFMKLYYHGGSCSLKEITKFKDEKKENVVRSEYISKRIKSLVDLGGE